MNPAVCVRPSSPSRGVQHHQALQADLLADAHLELERELSRLSAFVHRGVPCSSAAVVAVRVGGRLHVGGHGPEVDRIVDLRVEGADQPAAGILDGRATDHALVQGDLFWCASPERLAHLGITCVAAFPLRCASGAVVGSMSLFAASAAVLPSSDDPAFLEVIRLLGLATRSVRQSAVARQNTALLGGGPATSYRGGPRRHP